MRSPLKNRTLGYQYGRAFNSSSIGTQSYHGVVQMFWWWVLMMKNGRPPGDARSVLDVLPKKKYEFLR